MSKGGNSRSGVLGVTLPPQGIIPEGSPYSRELSLRMHLAAALILDGRERWVRQADQALAASSGSSFRPISTSNGGGSRLASSRGPWTSAELASRPVRRGRSKPKENALDSRKVGGHAIKIPGVGKGLKRRIPGRIAGTRPSASHHATSVTPSRPTASPPHQVSKRAETRE